MLDRRVWCGAMVVALCAWGAGPAEVQAGPVDLMPQAAATADEEVPLPKYMTDAERLLPLPEVPLGALRGSGPAGLLRTPAEYEQNDGILIRWTTAHQALQRAMAAAITNNDPEAKVYIVVDNSATQSSATTYLTNGGVDMSQVQFIIYTCNSVWIRDYGPRFVIEDGWRQIVDHTYNRPRPLDDAFPPFLGPLWGETVFNIPQVHGGGNLHIFSNGDAFMTSLIQNENPGMSERQIKEYWREYLKINVTIYPGFPTTVDLTQHIDMWMMPIGDNNVIIGQYNNGNPSYQPKVITDNAAADMMGRGYTVHRTPGWNSGASGFNGFHYTYTNAVFINDMILVPTYSAFPSQNATALAVYGAARPDKSIVSVDCSSIIQLAGAIHCIVMHVPTYEFHEPTVTVLSPLGGEYWVEGEGQTIRWNALDAEGVTSVDLYYSTDGGATYPHVIALGQPNDGAHIWTVPDTLSTQALVKVVAHDADTNSGEGVSTAAFTIAPADVELMYDFPLDSDPGWTTTGQWAYGQPLGGGGSQGAPDPVSGFTGSRVYGYNLSGDYAANISEQHLTTTAIDCTDLTNVQLRFQRWLGVEQPAYDHAYVRVSNNGTAWTTIWENTDTVDDGSWVEQWFDISAVADEQPTVYVRWTIGRVDDQWQYCGWNLDDVQLWAVRAPEGPLGDVDGDGDVDLADFATLAVCFSGPGPASPPAGCSPEEFATCDLDGDGDVDLSDFSTFSTNFGA